MDGVNPHRTRPTHVAFLLHMALVRMRSEAEAGPVDHDWTEAGPRQLTAAHFRLLDQLPAEGIRISDLAERTMITKQALSQRASQLVDRGYVEVVPDPGDRRAKLLRSTPAGQEATERARRTIEGIEARWRDRVGPDRYATFIGVLAEVVDGDAPAGTA